MFDTQRWRASPVWLLYNLRAIQFNVHAVQFFYLVSSRRRALIKMGVVWQKWAWSPKIFRRAPRALFRKNPPSLIPGSAPGYRQCSTAADAASAQM